MLERKPKPEDQENSQQAYEFLLSLIQDGKRKYPHIDSNQWVGGCFSCIVQAYINSGISYSEFYKEMFSILEFYKKDFE